MNQPLLLTSPSSRTTMTFTYNTSISVNGLHHREPATVIDVTVFTYNDDPYLQYINQCRRVASSSKRLFRISVFFSFMSRILLEGGGCPKTNEGEQGGEGGQKSPNLSERTLGAFKKYVRSNLAIFDPPPPPLFALVRFWTTPPLQYVR